MDGNGGFAHPSAGVNDCQSASQRKQHEDEIDAATITFCADKTRWQVVEALQNHQVASLPSLNAEDLVNNPHLQARQAFNQHPHPEVGKRSMLNPPWLLHNRPNGLGTAAPLLGQYTDQVLEDLLQLNAKQRADLKAQGVIESAEPPNQASQAEMLRAAGVMLKDKQAEQGSLG